MVHEVERARHRTMFLEAAGAIYRYPTDRFHGRGIVTCAGGVKYNVQAWVLLRLLRHLGCSLPIEVWYLGQDEFDERFAELVRPLEVNFVDARALSIKYPARILNGWELKCYSVIHCDFQEVLFLDADNAPVIDVSEVFEWPGYQERGAMFWPDRGRHRQEAPVWQATGLPFADEPEFESGQLIVNKRRCWKALNVAMHLNEYSDYWYRVWHGDKETFHFAWKACGQPYAMGPHPVIDRDGCLFQRDESGRVVFQHRNGRKWSLSDGNRPIADFAFEAECFGFLAELREQWLRIKAPHVQRRYRYVRCGLDSRVMEFLENGTIGQGNARLERRWRLKEDHLVIEGDEGVICTLRPDENGCWHGRWTRHERMGVVLVPA